MHGQPNRPFFVNKIASATYLLTGFTDLETLKETKK
jgi:hypothetical protein